VTVKDVIKLYFVHYQCLTGIGLRGNVLSAAREHDSIMVLALDRMFGKIPNV